MSASDVLTVVSVILAPFFAVFAQRKVDEFKERRSRRLLLFKTLMATRGASLGTDHVQALNMIELEFNLPDDEPVRRAWRNLLDHFNSGQQSTKQNDAGARAWDEKRIELNEALLTVMGRRVGYDFDPVSIRKAVYTPQGHFNRELEHTMIRQQLLEVLSGRTPVHFASVPADSKTARVSERLQSALGAILEGRTSLSVRRAPEKQKRTKSGRS